MKLTKGIFTISFLLFSCIASAQFRVDVEGGAVFTQYNEVRIPGNTGTFIDVNEHLDQKFSGHTRFRLGYTIANRHNISVLAAPLQLQYTGNSPYDIQFESALIGEDEPLRMRFRFNSYRLTYRYDFLVRDKIRLGAGVTGKVRDADISFISDDAADVKTDLGVVPLINLYCRWTPLDFMGFSLRADGLVGPGGGRAFDVALFYNQKLFDHVWLKAGYRMLEGGADNDELYTFSFFHYASVGLWVTHEAFVPKKDK